MIVAFTRVLLFIVMCLKYSEQESDACTRFSKNPYFEAELVVGWSWRIYYTWNINPGPKCLDIIYSNASKEVVQRFWLETKDYLEYEPHWNAASLLVTVPSCKLEMLLFIEQGAAGTFIGLPNVVRDGSPLPKMVYLLNKVQMKLVRKGKYLVVMDCQTGVTTLSSRKHGKPPTWVEITPIVEKLSLENGSPACTLARNKTDLFLA